MKNKELFKEQSRIETAKSNIQNWYEHLNNFIDVFNKMETGKEVTKYLLIRLINDVDNAINEIYLQKIPENQNGLKVNKNKVLETLELPNKGELKKLAQKLKTGIEYIDLIDIVKNKAVIDKVSLKEYLDEFIYYSNNEKEIQIYNQLQDVCNILNDLRKDYNIIKNSNIHGIDLAIFDIRSDKVVLSEKEFRGKISAKL